jgi:hypothetical protein
METQALYSHEEIQFLQMRYLKFLIVPSIVMKILTAILPTDYKKSYCVFYLLN